MKKNQVKIISFKATKFGIFKAFELDFAQFKQGILSLKGKSGEGKSTAQKAVKLTTQGRDSIADSEQYGEEWENEIQLLDGDRKIFIEAKKAKGKSPSFKLFEKDSEGKKVNNPIIDGVKATPAKYFEAIANEMTFGSKEFLSESETVHRKFMMKLFEPELKKLGVETLQSELKTLTSDRDYLRSQCTHNGAFIADFERDGYKKEQLQAMSLVDVNRLQGLKTDLLVKKGKVSGDAEADYQKRKADIVKRGAEVVEECRKLNVQFNDMYSKEKSEYDSNHKKNDLHILEHDALIKCLENSSFIAPETKEVIIHRLGEDLKFAQIPTYKPREYNCPMILDGKLQIEENISYEPEYANVFAKRTEIAKEFKELKEPNVSTEGIEKEINIIEGQILAAERNNKFVERFELNRQWTEACGKVEVKRGEIAKMYAQISTGVEGLYMKPFYNEEGKMSIKTVYTGKFSPDYFKNDGTDERLLVSYSSTQKPIIGILLQVARLKLKGKYLPYIFLDDVPMDKKSHEIIAKIAEENGLTIITSITGDFDKEKLSENEMLIEGGEVFFS